jgi:hypothetical protein
MEDSFKIATILCTHTVDTNKVRGEKMFRSFEVTTSRDPHKRLQKGDGRQDILH